MSQVSKGGENKETKVAFVGVVESDKRDKSRKVVVRYAAKHPKYGKFIQRQTVIHAHDEANEAREGDTVEVVPCRPMSKTKTWRITRIVEKKQTV
jgi:small subunit ribosomal protein S17